MNALYSRWTRTGGILFAASISLNLSVHAAVTVGPLATEAVCLEVTEDLAIVDVSAADGPVGKLLVIAEGWNDQYALSRHHWDGRIDETFSRSWHRTRLRMTRGLADGRTLVVSDSLAGDELQAMFRLTPNGQVDQTFQYEGAERISGMASDPDQRVFLYGVPSNNSGGVLWRLNENGGADESFTRVQTAFPILNVAFSDGAIFLQGQFGLAKFNTDGLVAPGFSSEAGSDSFGLWVYGGYVFTSTRAVVTIPPRFRLQRFSAATGRQDGTFPQLLFVPPLTHLDSAGWFYASSPSIPYPLRRYRLPEGTSDASYSGALEAGTGKIISGSDDSLLFLLGATASQAETNLNGIDVTCDRYPARAVSQAPSRNLGRVFLDSSRAPTVFSADRTGGRQSPVMLFEIALGGVVILGRAGNLDQPLTVRYALRSGTAQNQDHGGASGELTFAAGAQSASLSLTIIDDPEPEPLEYFYLDIFSFNRELLNSIQVRIASDDIGIPIERRRSLSDPSRWMVPAIIGGNAGSGIYSSATLDAWEPLPFEFYTYGRTPTGLRFFMFDSSAGNRFYRAE